MTSKTFTYAGERQFFTVPANIYSITVTALGASGGSPDGNNGGQGASITGDFTVTPGEELAVLVGGAGSFGPVPWFGAGGGGGGSFVWRGREYTDISTDTLLIAAGGGGGVGGLSGLNANTEGNGVKGDINGGDGGTAGSGGGGGNAGGGAGISGDGNRGGTSIHGGGTGGSGLYYGNPSSSGGGSGGFGGGGGGNVYDINTRIKASGGGGGGYSGGGGGGNSGTDGLSGGGGGGGSFNAGTNQNNTLSEFYGHGTVIISYISSSTRGIPFF